LPRAERWQVYTMTKSELVSKLRATRAEWDALFSDIEPAQMMRPNTVEDWSIKDVIFHCTRYASTDVHAMEAVLQGKPLPREVMDRTPLDERNQLDFQASRASSLEEVLAQAHIVFDQLIALTEAQNEEFLIVPQIFEGVPEPVIIWKQLDHVCNHYRDHMDAIQRSIG